MENNIDTTIEKIFIIQPITRENAGKYRVLQEEAVSLIESAGAAYAGTIYQNVREINPATYIGEGKLWELMTMETWTITYKQDDVREEGARISFNEPGTVYPYNE